MTGSEIFTLDLIRKAHDPPEKGLTKRRQAESNRDKVHNSDVIEFVYTLNLGGCCKQAQSKKRWSNFRSLKYLTQDRLLRRQPECAKNTGSQRPDLVT